MSNLKPFTLAEPLNGYVKEQIKIRQKLKGSGFGQEERTPQQLAYLTQQNSWVRCASAVDIDDTSRIQKIFSLEKSLTEDQLKSLKGTGLARRYVLFNGTSEDGSYDSPRGGYNTNADPLTNALYGVGGLEFGQVPMPGIESFSLDHINMGAIRSGELVIKAHNRIQFNIIETLYVQLGFHIFLEWGNNIYFDNKEDYITNNQEITTLIEDGTWFDSKLQNFETGSQGRVITPSIQFAEKVEEKRIKYSGNYDAFFGYVRNFNWTFQPDGTYQIIISLVSAGDVIEGIKVGGLSTNNLIREKTPQEGTSEDDLTIQAEGNTGDIRNYLYCLRNILDPEKTPFNKKSEITGKIDYVDISDKEFFKHDVKLPDLQYMRLGAFLKLIETLMLPYIDGQPMALVDEGDQSNFNLTQYLVSTDPSKCIIKNEVLLEDKGNKIFSGDNFKKKAQRVFKYFESVNNKSAPNKYGIIGNIYLKISHIEDLMKTLIGNKKNTGVNLIDILEVICDSINSCLGGYTSIHPSIQNDDEIILRELLMEPMVDSKGEKKQIDQEEKDGIIKAYGFNTSDNSSNIVREFSFKSEISNDLSNQISIGAAANDQTTKDVNPFFKELRRGLVDRYRPGKVTDGKPKERNDIPVEPFFESCRAVRKKASSSPSASPAATGTGVLGFRNLFSEEDIDNAESRSSQSDKAKKTEESKSKAQISTELYQSYLLSMFNSKFSTYFPYFTLIASDAERGSEALKLHLNATTQYTQNKAEAEGKKGGKNLIAFIPITLNLQLDGISGFKIYNRLSIDTEFLPVHYPDNIDFVILGIGHTLQDNDWVTNIRALSLPNYNSTDNEKAEEELFQPSDEFTPENASQARDEDNMLFFPPTGLLPFNIRNNGSLTDDNQGYGTFGASRKNRTHKGIDLKTTVPAPTPNIQIDLFERYPDLEGRAFSAGILLPADRRKPLSLISGIGTPIFAPITGTLNFTTASEDAVLPGVRIVGSGKYEGYESLIFYFAPNVKLFGKRVVAGQPIGTAVNIKLQPKYSDVSNHIHYGIFKNGEAIDPIDSKLEYTNNPLKIRSFESILTL